MSTTNIQFPQGPFVGEDGFITIEWQQWLQNPQFLTITFDTVIGVDSGGTGLASGTSGGVLAFVGTETMASSGELQANRIVLGGGAGATPSTPVGLGTTSTVLHGNAAGAPTFGLVALTTDVTGVLGVTNGGTGVTTSTGSGANVLNVSPSLQTPDLGTPTAAILTNATGLPLATGVTGNLPLANLPSAGISVTITTAKLNTIGANGSMTFTNGVLTAQTQAT